MTSSTRARKRAWAAAIFLGAAAGVALLLLAELALFPWLGLVHRRALPLEERLGNLTVVLSAKWHAGHQRNPLEQNASTFTIGQNGYRPCAECHGVQADGRGELGQSVFPPAASLLSPGAKAMSDAQLFWIIKHGLSFTAMPSYAKQYSDNGTWAIVSYIRALQQGRALTFGPPPPGQVEAQRAEPQTVQRFPLSVTDSGLQPASLTARPGIVELDIANQGASGHQLVVSEAGKIPFNAGRLFPTQTLRLQGRLDAGDYRIAVDPSGSSPGPVATLTVR